MFKEMFRPILTTQIVHKYQRLSVRNQSGKNFLHLLQSCGQNAGIILNPDHAPFFNGADDLLAEVVRLQEDVRKVPLVEVLP